MGNSPNLSQLPLILNLLALQKNKSFIDRKICLNAVCQHQHSPFVPNYFSEIKLNLYKPDSEKVDICNKCDGERYCAIYICKFCDHKACYYCLTESTKIFFVQNLAIESQTNVLKPSAIMIQPPDMLPTPNLEKDGSPDHLMEINQEDLMHNEIVIQNFGKYLHQFVEFSSWAIPSNYFVNQPEWIKKHGKVPPFNFVVYSDQSPKIHDPDRLELELVSIGKQQNYQY